MSGGHFYYKQHYITDIADEILNIVNKNDTKDEYGYSTSFSEETLKRLSCAVLYLKHAGRIANVIDRLVSGDTSEETFIDEWKSMLW